MLEPARPALLEELERIELLAPVGQSVLAELLLEPLALLVVPEPLDLPAESVLLWPLVVLEHSDRLSLWRQHALLLPLWPLVELGRPRHVRHSEQPDD